MKIVTPISINHENMSMTAAEFKTKVSTCPSCSEDVFREFNGEVCEFDPGYYNLVFHRTCIDEHYKQYMRRKFDLENNTNTLD